MNLKLKRRAQKRMKQEEQERKRMKNREIEQRSKAALIHDTPISSEKQEPPYKKRECLSRALARGRAGKRK